MPIKFKNFVYRLETMLPEWWPVWLTITWYTELVFRRPITLRKIICRWRGHPAGIVFYNPSGWEPDYHCKNCDDDLG